MNPADFWDGDPALAESFREAHKLKQEAINSQLWMQGAYMYTALCNVAPIFNSNSKKGTKPRPYPDKPFQLQSSAGPEKKKSEAQRIYEEKKRRFEMQVAAINGKFREAGD